MSKILEAIVEPFAAALYPAAHTRKPRQFHTERTSPYRIGSDFAVPSG